MPEVVRLAVRMRWAHKSVRDLEKNLTSLVKSVYWHSEKTLEVNDSNRSFAKYAYVEQKKISGKTHEVHHSIPDESRTVLAEEGNESKGVIELNSGEL